MNILREPGPPANVDVPPGAQLPNPPPSDPPPNQPPVVVPDFWQDPTRAIELTDAMWKAARNDKERQDAYDYWHSYKTLSGH